METFERMNLWSILLMISRYGTFRLMFVGLMNQTNSFITPSSQFTKSCQQAFVMNDYDLSVFLQRLLKPVESISWNVASVEQLSGIFLDSIQFLIMLQWQSC